MAAMNQNPKDTGWFYSPPGVKGKKEKVIAPPLSQIPGIGIVQPPEREKPKEMIFKSTDTDYTCLSKMGGRKDLLAFNCNPIPKPCNPLPYPRNDWFYLEDNAKEDAKAKTDNDSSKRVVWRYEQPEYMTHEIFDPCKVPKEPEGYTYVPMREPPFARDSPDAPAKGNFCSNNQDPIRYEICEPKHHGIRTSNYSKDQMYRRTMSSTSQPPRDNYRQYRRRFPCEAEEPVDMGKLMSNTYQKEYDNKLVNWQNTQIHNQSNNKCDLLSPDANNPLAGQSAIIQRHANRKSQSWKKPSNILIKMEKEQPNYDMITIGNDTPRTDSQQDSSNDLVTVDS